MKDIMRCLDLHNRKKQALAVRLPSYKPLNILVRFVIVSIIAVGILHLIDYVIGPDENNEKSIYFYYLIMILAFNIASEFQILLDNILERFLPIPEKLRLRIFLQIVFSFIFLYVALHVLMLIMAPEMDDDGGRPGLFMGLISGLLFVQFLANGLILARTTQKLLDSQEQIAAMKREKLEMSYNSLQDQLNPHFLFNNLSVLKSLIIYDQDAAVEFTENFTDVYRYVLQSRDKKLVKFKDELEFIEAFGALHKERLGEGLNAKVSIKKEDLDKEIAPLTMQLLIENAIKHNIASRETPLLLEIYVKDNCLVIANSLNRKEASYSTKTGLKNLMKRYEMLTDREIVVQHNDEKFEVKVPLL